MRRVSLFQSIRPILSTHHFPSVGISLSSLDQYKTIHGQLFWNFISNLSNVRESLNDSDDFEQYLSQFIRKIIKYNINSDGRSIDSALSSLSGLSSLDSSLLTVRLLIEKIVSFLRNGTGRLENIESYKG